MLYLYRQQSSRLRRNERRIFRPSMFKGIMPLDLRLNLVCNSYTCDQWSGLGLGGLPLKSRGTGGMTSLITSTGSMQFSLLGELHGSHDSQSARAQAQPWSWA